MKNKAFPALLLSFCILLPALAQTTPAPTPQKPSDDQDEVVKITTNLVQVDAVVTKDGKMVTNLTANDFEIYEDGKQQPITSFAFISNVPNKSPAQPIARDKNKTDGPPEAPINPNDPHRTIAFVVDDLGISAESMGQVRRQLRKFVAEELQANDLVAIIRTGGEMGALQQFTNDKRLLNRAVDRLRWNGCSRVGVNVFHSVGSGPEPDGFRCGYSYTQTGRALRFIIDGLGQLPGRKSMVIMSDDLPRETQEIGVADMDFLGDRSAPGQPDPRGGSLRGFRETVDFSMMLRRIAEKAIRSSVVIYSVDTQGLQYTGGTAADSIRGDSRSIAQSLSALSASRSRLLWNRREGGELIARQTGGYQIHNSNSYRLDDILEDQSGYYLIGYRPSDDTFNRRLHRIKAKVKGSGLSLRTRFGFFGFTEEEAEHAKAKPATPDLTNLALASPFAAQDIDLDLTAFFANDPGMGSVVRSFVYIDARNLTFTAENDRHQAGIELNGVIFGDNGTIVEQISRNASLSLSEDDYQQAINYGMGLAFDIPVKKPGSYQVRVAARDLASSHIGSTGQFVDVPDLKKKQVAVSGIVLGTNSADQTIANPGARRFTANSELFFGYKIYNGVNENRKLRNMTMQATLFRDGKNVYSGPETTITATNQTDLTRVFVSGVIKLNPDLEAGNYFLQVVVTDKDADKKTPPVVQWVDFELQK